MYNELVRRQKHVIVSIIQVPHVKARCFEKEGPVSASESFN